MVGASSSHVPIGLEMRHSRDLPNRLVVHYIYAGRVLLCLEVSFNYVGYLTMGYVSWFSAASCPIKQ